MDRTISQVETELLISDLKVSTPPRVQGCEIQGRRPYQSFMLAGHTINSGNGREAHISTLNTDWGTSGQPMRSNGGSVMEEAARYLRSPRVLWGAGALTNAAAVVSVLAVRAAVVRVLHPDPAFTPLTLASPIVATLASTMMAIYVFVGMVSYPNPVRTWRRVSAVVLILSFLPCVLLAISHIMGGGWSEACALMTMHVAVWAICVTLLPSLAVTKHPTKNQAPDRPLSIL